MSDEKKLNTEEEQEQLIAAPATDAAAKAAPVEEVDEERDDVPFSLDSSADEELPEEIKQKLEKNKQARAKKKLVKKRKKRAARTVKVGRAYINATYNNTMVTLADANGDVIAWASAGMAGFKGAKKATPYAAQIITKIAAQKAKENMACRK